MPVANIVCGENPRLTRATGKFVALVQHSDKKVLVLLICNVGFRFVPSLCLWVNATSLMMQAMLVLWDSHRRAMVDAFVGEMPEGRLSFGCLC